MKRLLPVAAVLLAAVPWVFAVTQRPGAAHPERAGVTPPAAARATPAPDHEPASPEAAESPDRFKTGCGWCDPQVSELGGTCVAFCAENSGGVSCAAAGGGGGGVVPPLSGG